jgi:hypothetical protein
VLARAVLAGQVGVDTGLHLGLRVPASLTDPTAGQVITPEVAVGLLVRHGWQTQDFARSEVLRYLAARPKPSPTRPASASGCGCEPRPANAFPG